MFVNMNMNMNISWMQRKRNLERFFHKRTGSFFSPPTTSFSPPTSFSLTHSFSPKLQDVSLSSRASHQEVHEASLYGDGNQRAKGESALQQTELRPGQKDETSRLLLPADRTIHGRGTDAIAATRRWRRVDHRTTREELQDLPKE